MKRRISILFIFMLLFQSMESSFAMPMQAIAAGVEQEEEKRIIRGYTVVDEEGELVDLDSITETTNVSVLVDWSVDGVEVEAGTSESIKLPEELSISEEQSDALANDVGEYNVLKDGTISVSFNQTILENLELSGTLEVAAVVVVEVSEDEAKKIGPTATITNDVVTEGELEEPASSDSIEESETTTNINTAEGNVNPVAFDIGIQRELGNIFTFESLKIGDENINDGDVIVIVAGTITQLGFSWNTEGLNAKAGDTSEIQLSDAFKMVNTPVQPVEVEGKNVGTYQIENGILKFIFNEGIEESDVKNGFVNLGLEFNLDKFRENIEQQIPFNDGHENNITVIAKPNLDHSGIEKEGHPDSQNDAREITWTIDVINTNDQEITEATLADNIPDGLGEARDFVIHELSVGYDGDISEGADVTSTLIPSEFPIDLGTVTPFNGYRVQYTTTIENYATETFTNDATFEYGETSLLADDTVGGLTRSNPIEKDGWQVGDGDIIHWQIDVNKNGSLINEAIVEDNLPAGLTIIPGSIEVVRITQAGDTWREGDAHEESFTKFPMRLGELGQEDAYRIKFKTDIDWSKVNTGEYLENNGFQNKTILYEGKDELNDDEATVNIKRDPILEKVEVGNVDYDNRTVTWEVTVNKAKHPLGDVTVTDILPEGLLLDKEDINITGDEANDFSGVTPIIDTTNNGVNDGNTKLSIDLTNVGTETVTIKYTTSIDDFTTNYFTNTVGMTGKGVGEGGEDREVTINPNENTYTKSYADIDYNAKTIDWRLNVNPVREDINSGFIITDTFTNNGLILLPDTLNIMLGNDELVAETDYTVAPIDDGYQNGFTITFNKEIANGELVVKYTTSYDPQLEGYEGVFIPHSNEEEKELYRNKAEFDGTTENEITIDEEDDASQKVREESWNSGKKEGQLVHFDDEDSVVNGWESGSERKIAWQFYFNYQEQNLGTGVVVTDELAYAGNIDEESIQVSVYNVAPDGETTITSEVLDPSNYSLNTEQDSKFILTFAEEFELTERYVITFTTSVPDISSESYTNNATVKAGDVNYDYSATLNYNEYDDFLNKSAINLDGDRVFTGDEVEWRATVNESLSIVKNAVITDTISVGHIYLEDSLEIYRSHDRENALEEGADYNLDVVSVIDDNGEPTGATNLIITIDDDLQDTLVLEYTTVVTETDGEIGNSISLDGTAIDQQVIESDRVTARQFSSVGGEWASNRGALRVTKVDTDENTIETGTATFELWYDLNGERVQFEFDEPFTTVNGVLEVGNLPLRTYYLTEVEAPNGYILSDEEIEIVVDQTYNNHMFEVPFKNVKEVEVNVKKIWNDVNNQDGLQPDAITVNLLANNVEMNSAELNADNDWSTSFAELPEVDKVGTKIDYTIEEVEVPNYESDIVVVGDNPYNFTVTNTHEVEKTSITVTKDWDDGNNQDGNRPPSIEVQLYIVNGEELEEVGEPQVVTSEQDWTHTWSDLDVNANGEPIEYIVEELNVTEEYEVNINNDDQVDFVITNSYTPEVIDIPVTKVWADEGNQDGVRPSKVTLNLLNERGEVVKSAVVQDQNSNEWVYTFTDLPKYENGEEIKYSVTENTVAEYSASYAGDLENGFVITNTHTPDKTSVTVTKGWDDDNNQDGNRPTSIEVQLLANGNVVEHESPKILTTGNWTYTWSGLDANADGKTIEYTVEELSVPEGYEVTVDARDHGNIIITNSYEPETTKITVNKTWEDEENQDSVRPNNVTVNLLANGEIARQTVLNEDNKWQHTFTDLPVNKNGVAIKYTVTENTVPDYSTEIDEFSITNTHTPEQTSVTVNKAWDDANNQDGIRSESVELQLTANGEDVGEPVELNAANYWTYTWDELDLNAEGEAIKYSVRELNVPEGYEVRVNDNDHGNIIVTNSYAPAVTEVSVSKTWDDEEDRDRIRPGNVTVNLLADFEIVRQVVLSEANNWEHIFRNLPVYNNGVEIEYSITENTVANYSTSIDEFDITNFYTPEKTTATVSKSWDDSNDQDGIRPETIEVQLYANDVPYGDPVELMTDNWTYTWDDLPLNDAGEPIVYTVQEVEVPEGYEVSYNINDHGNLIITNYHEPAVTEVDVSKIWDDANDQDGIRPEVIAINLFANGELVESKEISAEDNWEHTFTDLPKYVAGVEIVYTIEEESVEGYETSIDEENTVTNSHTPEVLTISGTKTWNDANNQDGIRPESITVNLLADGTQIADITVTEEDGWVYEFTDLPKYRDGGIEIIYTITEDSVNEYTTEIDGYNVTNHYTPGETSVTVTKHWDDADNQDGIRPGSIEVQLTGDGEAVGETVELSAENNWTHTWTELDEKAAGQTIIYSVVEVTELPKYETIINDENQGNIMITNSYTPETTEVIGTKTWNDADNQDGIRPETITVNLYANGEATDSIEVTVEENWSYQFNDLPKYEAGEEIIYTVTEDAVEGYEPSIDGTDITNTHIPEVIDVNGTKIWNDANNQDGVRPESITVNLYADGEAIDSVEVTAEDNWNYSFDNLPKYEAGEEIVYTITEDDVENYETTINGFNITNSYTPETTEITGTKSWNDADNQDGIRPESITVNLLANGEKVAEAEVTAADDWNYSFVDVPKYENGKEITYTVTENAVESYTPEYNGFDITNHYTPGETAVTVTKHWDDATNQDGIRPESIEVQLIANGEAIGDAIVLSEANDWTHTWTELAEKADGTTIVYTVEEITNLPAYEVTVDDANHGNIIITNAYTPKEIEITGTKTWEDNNNEAGNRPTSITVNLYADGELSNTMTVSEEDNWNFSFTNLPKYNNGEEIEYTITENPVTGYETTINGFDITNTLIDEVESENAMVDADTDEQDGTGGTLTDSAGEANQLPKTATNMYNLLAIGLGILILGIAIALYQRRRQTN